MSDLYEEDNFSEENGRRLKSFIEGLTSLSKTLSSVFTDGRMDISVLERMNKDIEQMAQAEKGESLEEFTAISGDTKTIYYNFNAIVQMIESQESRFMDETTMKAVNVFLRNINNAAVSIASAYGLIG